MLHTYILRTESTGRPCIGSTSDLRRRIDEHIGGLPKATRNRGPGRLAQTMAGRQPMASPLVAQLYKSDGQEQGVFGFHQGCSYAGLPSRFAPSIAGSRSSPIRKRFLRPTPGQKVLAGFWLGLGFIISGPSLFYERHFRAWSAVFHESRPPTQAEIDIG